MKINITKIGEFELLKKEYLSDSIFRFKINSANRFSVKVEELHKNLSEPQNKSIQFLKNSIAKNNYEGLGTVEELMIKNLTHSLKADWYYTNGQEIISILKIDQGWEIGKFGKIFDFQNAISEYYPMCKFGLKTMKLESYKIFEKAELLIMTLM